MTTSDRAKGNYSAFFVDVLTTFCRPQDPTLYPLTLTYFSSTPEILSQSTAEVTSVLDLIDERNLLPPVQVVQALGMNSVATVGLVKDYLTRKIDGARKAIEEVCVVEIG